MYSESSTFPNFYIFTNISVLKYLLLISWFKSKMYSRKDILPNYIEFAKNQKRIGRFFWSQQPYNGNFYFEPCIQLLNENELGQIKKKPSKSILMKKKGKRNQQYGILLFTMQKTWDSFLYWNPILTKTQPWSRNLRSVMRCMT